MFAFAIWERDSGQLFIARDRLGVKPLYLSRTGQRLRFASTLPALLKGGDIASDLNPVALNHYMSFHAVVPAPDTLIAGIEKLPPASWMRVGVDGTTSTHRWWTLEYGARDDEQHYSFEDWQRRTLDTLREAWRSASAPQWMSACCCPAASIPACWSACCARQASPTTC